MAVSEGKAIWAADQALKAQGYRPVAIESLTDSGQISLPTATVPGNVTQILHRFGQDPNWLRIAQQLALLKSTSKRGFRGVYLRPDRFNLEIVAIHVWGGGVPLRRDFVRGEFEMVWTIINSLTPDLGRFQLSEQVQGSLIQARDFILGPAKQAEEQLVKIQRKKQASPNTLFANALSGNLQWYAIAYSILDTILNLHYSRTPTGTLLDVALSGVRDDLVRDLSDLGGIGANDPLVLGVTAPNAWALVWDVPNRRLLGKNPPASVNRRDLEENLLHLSQQ